MYASKIAGKKQFLLANKKLFTVKCKIIIAILNARTNIDMLVPENH